MAGLWEMGTNCCKTCLVVNECHAGWIYFTGHSRLLQGEFVLLIYSIIDSALY